MQEQNIFVFGSNRLGIHGAGAAKDAVVHYGARHGQGEGLQGQSYAIPTKHEPYKKMSLTDISIHVEKFIAFAKIHPEMNFFVTPIGCGMAGHKPMHIAPMFQNAPANVFVPTIFSMFYDIVRSSVWNHTRKSLSPIVDPEPVFGQKVTGKHSDLIIVDELESGEPK